MFCTNCGAQIMDGAKFCSACGTPVPQSALNTPDPPAAATPDPVFPQNTAAQPAEPAAPYSPAETGAPYGYTARPTENNAPYSYTAQSTENNAPYSYAAQPSENNAPYGYTPPAYPAYDGPSAPQAQEPELSMKWFKFTIYFQLFANAVLNVFNALSSLLGLNYGDVADDVYAYYRGLRGLDVCMGFLYLALAAFAIVTRFRLARFRKNGPALLYLFLICNLVVLLFYTVAASVLTGMNLFDTTTISNAITLVVLLVCDYIYFNKRSHLFVN